ncbi:MAG: hypothetical protein Q9170_007753 [Blastenia crenularia]
MSVFTALNIEPESDSEDDIDNTKELQIEEALKLYQNALKLHSQGPRFFDEAERAYSALFRSEVFAYLESVTESERIEYYAELEDEAASNHDHIIPDQIATADSNTDGTPSTLPQILYLSYKNHAYYLLDRLKFSLQATSNSDHGLPGPGSEPKEISETLLSSLTLLVVALERDDSDTELWRHISRIGQSLGSRRIARFCLEAVLDREDVGGNAWPEPLGLQELFAAEQLRELSRQLDDDVSESAVPLLTRKQQGIVRPFKTQLDPLPYLPVPDPDVRATKFEDQKLPAVAKLQIPIRSWASCGKVILSQLQQETQGLVESNPGVRYSLALPLPVAASSQGASVAWIGTVLPDTIHVSKSLNGQLSRKGDEPSMQYQEHSHIEKIDSGKIGAGPKLPPEPVLVEASQMANVSVQGTEQIEQNAYYSAARSNGIPSPELNDNQPQTVTLPTRKRSNEAAELEDAEETGRSRSKRIKARTSIDEPASRREAAAKQQLELYQHGELQYFNFLDEQAFGCLHRLLSSCGIVTALTVRERRAAIVSLARALNDTNGESSFDSTNPDEMILKDLSLSLLRWNSDMSSVFLHGGGPEDPVSGASAARNSGLLVFLEQSSIKTSESTPKPVLGDDRDLDLFVHHINTNEGNLERLAFAWIEALLSRKGRVTIGLPEAVGSRSSRKSSVEEVQSALSSSAYENFLWPDQLKETMVQMLVQFDEFVFGTLFDRVSDSTRSQSGLALESDAFEDSSRDLIQNIFELHLDVYGRITNPNSKVDTQIRTAQFDRLRRWASLAYHARFELERNGFSEAADQSCSIRFLWAYAVLANSCEMCSRDMVIAYFQDLRSTLERLGSPVIELRNNAVMPEISVMAAEKQISRLMTMDFFISVFSPTDDDPVALIESLEPVLEQSLQRRSSTVANRDNTELNYPLKVTTDEPPEAQQESTPPPEPHTEQMLQFLDKASLSMQLMLWRRLIDAYSIVQYSPRILLCYLRCIELIVGYLRSAQHLNPHEDHRKKRLLRWLRSLDDLLTWSLALAWSDPQSRDCMDEANLHSAISTLSNLQNMLHPILTVDDFFKIGLCEAPEQPTNSANTAYNHSMLKLREMVVRTWSLQYILTREIMTQSLPATSTTCADLFQCLTSIHRAFGPRSYCKLADKAFLRLARRELLTIGNYCDSEIEGAQIILDAYGMRIWPLPGDVEDHGCPTETLYRSDAIGIMDRVLVQANKVNIKELIKSDLRSTLEKMQQAIKIPKTTTPVLHNRRVFDRFLRSPISPLNLYRALQGIGELPFQPAHGEGFLIAEKGWYFLQGYVALAKFRSQKRTTPGGSDELDIALKFFQHDLEHGYEKWETWYRLAQVYDAKLDEATIWTADKLNESMEDVVNLQRSAIHCYTMAIATAERCAEPTLDMFQKMADLYSDFGMRIYASSREPFSMDAFSVEKFTKHFNGGRQGTYQGKPFKPISLYANWKFASALLRRALTHKSDHWMTWYMLGKCLWKMHNCHDYVLCGRQRIDFAPALNAFKRAIEFLPERRDSKHPEKDPMLESHYKLASIVQKLVSSRRLNAEAGCEVLSATSYARKVNAVREFDDWEGYILQVLKALRSADKSNWHHRMVLRSARTIYDESPNDHMAILAAKHELTQQIFTKSMTVQVWKPENERVGRHFVYTTRYVQFFLRLLFELKDRPTIEALGRQIRKKPGKFFRHGQLWHELCMTHLKLLRAHCLLPEELSDTVFKNISHEVFVQNADRLESWAHLPSTESPIIEILKEAIELKKTNANLMKPSAIEDFIADAYTHLHQTIVPELIARSNEEESRGRMRVDHLMNIENPPISTPSPGPSGNPEDAAPARQRIRGVGRREIQKRAEAMINKPTAAQVSVKAPKSPPPANDPTTPRSVIQVVIKQDEPMRENSSVPGSVHDSADDESELSDVEATSVKVTARPLFPNLGDSKDGLDEEKEGSEEYPEPPEDEAPEDEQPDDGRPEDEEPDDEQPEEKQPRDEPSDEDEHGEGEGEETYHTPMEM